MTMFIQLHEDGAYWRQIQPLRNFAFGPNHFQPPETLTEQEAELLRVHPLAATPKPDYNPLTQDVRPATPVLTAGQWTQQWEVYPLPAEDIESNRRAKAVQLRMDLRAEYERRTAQIANPYPPSERESWPVQISEARELQADPAAITPWINAAADARGMDRAELAARIVALDTAYRTIHGALTGARQRIEGLIDAAAKDLAALVAIDVKAGWPE